MSKRQPSKPKPVELPWAPIHCWLPGDVALVKFLIEGEVEVTKRVGIGPVEVAMWKKYKDFIAKIPQKPSVHDIYEDMRITHSILRTVGLDWS